VALFLFRLFIIPGTFDGNLDYISIDTLIGFWNLELDSGYPIWDV
jgi:hypothetical protein